MLALHSLRSLGAARHSPAGPVGNPSSSPHRPCHISQDSRLHAPGAAAAATRPDGSPVRSGEAGRQPGHHPQPRHLPSLMFLQARGTAGLLLCYLKGWLRGEVPETGWAGSRQRFEHWRGSGRAVGHAGDAVGEPRGGQQAMGRGTLGLLPPSPRPHLPSPAAQLHLACPGTRARRARHSRSYRAAGTMSQPLPWGLPLAGTPSPCDSHTVMQGPGETPP